MSVYESAYLFMEFFVLHSFLKKINLVINCILCKIARNVITKIKTIFSVYADVASVVFCVYIQPGPLIYIPHYYLS